MMILEVQVFQRQFRRSLQMQRIIANARLCVVLWTATTVPRVDQHTANSRTNCLLTRIHPVERKKITEDILHKTYTEKGAITGI